MSDQLVLVEPDRPTARCRRCFRLLRDPESVARRLGPMCMAKDLASATDAIDLAFAIAWQSTDDTTPRDAALRWFRAGAQAVPPVAP